MGNNSETGTKKPNQIEIDNFGKNEKVDFDMNVFIITETNLKNLFKKLIGKENEEINIDRNLPFTHKNYKGWNFIYLEKNIDEDEDVTVLFNFSFTKINEEKNRKENNKDVLIINLSNINYAKNYLELIINQNYKEEYQPFILFLTNEDNINGEQNNIRNLIRNIAEEKIKEEYKNDENLKKKKLDNLIPNEYYMLYNIFLCQYRENELNDLNIINNYLLQFASCYNEIGDYFSNNLENNNLSYNFVNILCVGRTCTGKSTFINTFFNERKCPVGGRGLSKTKRITFYSDFSRQVRIYDTKGFEGEVTNSKIIELLQKLKVELVNCNKKIHLILYFLEGKTNFEEHEYKVFNEILKYKTKVIFIKTHCRNNSKAIYDYEKEKLFNNIRVIYKKLEEELYNNKISRQEINEIRDLYINILLQIKNENNLILMNLRKHEDEDKENITKIFGMKELYIEIYKYLKPHIIKLQNIEIIKPIFDESPQDINESNNDFNTHPIYSIIKDNLFLGSYKTIRDILSLVKSEKKWIISKNCFYAALSGLDPIPFVDIGTYYLIEKNLKKELASLYHFNLEENNFLNEEINNEEEIKKNKERNDEKDNVHLKGIIGCNSTKTIVQGIKVGKNIKEIVNDAKYVNNLKNAINAFVNGCKSSIIFISVGLIVGGIFNVGLIIYEGNLFSNDFENALKKDGGNNYLESAAKSYNKAIKSFKDLAEINDDENIIYE